MKQKKFFFMVLVITIIAACSMTAYARGFGPGPHRHGSWAGFGGMKGFLELGLSETQQAKMLEIMDKYRDEHIRLHDLMRKSRAEIRNAMEAERLDEAALRRALKGVSSVKEELFVLRARMKTELKAVLTPGQARILEERKARFHKCKGRPIGGQEVKDR